MQSKKIENMFLAFEVTIIVIFLIGAVVAVATSYVSIKSVIPMPIINKTLNKTIYDEECCIPIYESGGYASRGATLYALKDVHGNYHLLLAILPVKGEYWDYKPLPWSYNFGLRYVNFILVITPNNNLEIYYYDFTKKEFIFLEKVPDNIANKLLNDIKSGLYELYTPNEVKPI